jgi:hypothetical protein
MINHKSNDNLKATSLLKEHKNNFSHYLILICIFNRIIEKCDYNTHFLKFMGNHDLKTNDNLLV